MEVSEPVDRASVGLAVTSGELTLEDDDAEEGIDLSASQPVTLGRLAGKRIVLAPDAPIADGTNVTLTLGPEALTDSFLNRPTTAYQVSFIWPADDSVIADHAAPRVDQVLVRDRIVEIQLTEEIDLASAEAAITIDGQAETWTLSEDRYTLTGSTELEEGSHTLSLSAGLLDLAGTSLSAAASIPVAATGAIPSSIAYRAPDPRVAPTSLVGNPVGFQGHPLDPETGFIYIRNRYMDPEMGRFITADPLGFVDGPSPYAYANSNPVNFSDPMGLVCPECRGDASRFNPDPAGTTWTDIALATDSFERGVAERITELPADLVNLPRDLLSAAFSLSDAARFGLDCALIDFDRCVEIVGDYLHAEWEVFLEAAPEEHARAWGRALVDAGIAAGGAVAAEGRLASQAGRAEKVLPERRPGPRAATPEGSVPRGANAAYEAAVGGGRHAGLLKNYAGRSAAEVEKGIISLERQAALHGEKVANPAQFAERWGQMSAQEQAGLLSYWQKEAARYQEQAEVLRGLLGGS